MQARPLAFSARGLNRRVNPFYRDCFVHAAAWPHQVRLQVWLPPGMWRHSHRTAEEEEEEEEMPSLLGIQHLHLSSLLGQQLSCRPDCALQRELSRQRVQRLQLAEVQQQAGGDSHACVFCVVFSMIM